MKPEIPAEQQDEAEECSVLVVRRSFSFEVLPDVAERVIERTKSIWRTAAPTGTSWKRSSGAVRPA